MTPEIRYARNGRVPLAHQVVGDGPVDLVLVPGFASQLDAVWDEPRLAAFLTDLAEHARLILYDAREQGLSDRLGHAPGIDEGVSDLAAVLDAAGSERAVLLGVSQGGPTAIAFAAIHPARTLGLILYGAYAKAARADDHPIGPTQAVIGEFADLAAQHWGGNALLPLFAPSAVEDRTSHAGGGARAVPPSALPVCGPCSPAAPTSMSATSWRRSPRRRSSSTAQAIA